LDLVKVGKIGKERLLQKRSQMGPNSKRQRRWFSEPDRRQAEVQEYIRQSNIMMERVEKTLRETAELKKLIGPDPRDLPKKP